MKWIGLTGGLGSGKSTVAKRIRELGYMVADADQIARSALDDSPEVRAAVQQKFGTIDRKKIGEIVFKSKADLLWLESQIHPHVRKEMQRLRIQWESEGKHIAFYDVPLLYEKNMEDLFDAVVVVVAPPDQILKRVLERDKITPENIKERIQNQIPLGDKAKRADHVVVNDKSLEHLFSQVDHLLSILSTESQ